MKQEDINLLKQLGLTTYEAKAYITLSSLIQATADEISDKSDIPRSKIYDVLKRLNSKRLHQNRKWTALNISCKSSD